MAGMSRITGAAVGGFDHLRQSIQDILSTPVGTRVHRRDYGSDLPRLVDRPMNATLASDMVAAAAVTRSTVMRSSFNRGSHRSSAEAAGQIELSLSGYYLLNGQKVEMEGLVI
jgi:phage baseplate assembly protein W